VTAFCGAIERGAPFGPADSGDFPHTRQVYPARFMRAGRDQRLIPPIVVAGFTPPRAPSGRFREGGMVDAPSQDKGNVFDKPGRFGAPVGERPLRLGRRPRPGGPQEGLGDAPVTSSLGVALGIVILSPGLMLLAFLICGFAARSWAVVTLNRLAIFVRVSPETTV